MAEKMSNIPEEREPVADDRGVEELVRQAQAGKTTAFDELVRQFHVRIFNLAFRMTNDMNDAADLTQEVFVKAYDKINSFEGKSRFSTWLYALALNICRSGLRRLKSISSREVLSLDRKKDPETGRGRYEPADAGDLPGKALERQDTMRVVEKAIAGLPEEFRTVIVLRDLQDLAYEEIAETLDCSVGTVKSRLARARTRVKDALKREGLTCAATI